MLVFAGLLIVLIALGVWLQSSQEKRILRQHKPEIERLPKLLEAADPEATSAELLAIVADPTRPNPVRYIASLELLAHRGPAIVAPLMEHREVLGFSRLVEHALKTDIAAMVLSGTAPDWSEAECIRYMQLWFGASKGARVSTLKMTADHVVWKARMEDRARLMEHASKLDVPGASGVGARMLVLSGHPPSMTIARYLERHAVREDAPVLKLALDRLERHEEYRAALGAALQRATGGIEFGALTLSQGQDTAGRLTQTSQVHGALSLEDEVGL